MLKWLWDTVLVLIGFALPGWLLLRFARSERAKSGTASSNSEGIQGHSPDIVPGEPGLFCGCRCYNRHNGQQPMRQIGTVSTGEVTTS
jgi:hypothetical protein